MKTVFLPIRVPEGEYCWNWNLGWGDTNSICRHFDNEGGNPNCEYPDLNQLKRDRDNGILKSKACLELGVEKGFEPIFISAPNLTNKRGEYDGQT